MPDFSYELAILGIVCRRTRLWRTHSCVPR
jgi:hypothetical protein